MHERDFVHQSLISSTTSLGKGENCQNSVESTALALLLLSIRMQFCTHPVPKRTTLFWQVEFSPVHTISARADRCAYRNGNTAVPFGRSKRKGGPDDVTKSLWRNILLIHVRLYNLAHFYSERGAAARRARLGVPQCRYSIFVPYFPNFTGAATSPFKKK